MFIPQLRWKIIGFEPSPSHIIGSSNVIHRKPVQYKYIYLIILYNIDQYIDILLPKYF